MSPSSENQSSVPGSSGHEPGRRRSACAAGLSMRLSLFLDRLPDSWISTPEVPPEPDFGRPLRKRLGVRRPHNLEAPILAGPLCEVALRRDVVVLERHVCEGTV